MTDPQLSRELAELRQRVADLEAGIGISERIGDLNGVPDSMLFSDSFLRRAFAVLGHYFVASLIVALPFYLLIFLGAALFGTAL
ncbi:hypothetical protein [Rubrivirga sp.]|uniref:hypothetical protein n=1 Tax=Rubrivirga sp. TaxID=1885344 RepID=UPI003C731A68